MERRSTVMDHAALVSNPAPSPDLKTELCQSTRVVSHLSSRPARAFLPQLLVPLRQGMDRLVLVNFGPMGGNGPVVGAVGLGADEGERAPLALGGVGRVELVSLNDLMLVLPPGLGHGPTKDFRLRVLEELHQFLAVAAFAVDVGGAFPGRGPYRRLTGPSGQFLIDGREPRVKRIQRRFHRLLQPRGQVGQDGDLDLRQIKIGRTGQDNRHQVLQDVSRVQAYAGLHKGFEDGGAIQRAVFPGSGRLAGDRALQGHDRGVRQIVADLISRLRGVNPEDEVSKKQCVPLEVEREDSWNSPRIGT